MCGWWGAADALTMTWWILKRSAARSFVRHESLVQQWSGQLHRDVTPVVRWPRLHGQQQLPAHLLSDDGRRDVRRRKHGPLASGGSLPRQDVEGEVRGWECRLPDPAARTSVAACWFELSRLSSTLQAGFCRVSPIAHILRLHQRLRPFVVQFPSILSSRSRNHCWV